MRKSKKIVCISDTHGKHTHLEKDLPEADMIIHAGDVSNMGRPEEIKEFLDWFSNLDYKHKVFIAGNHDFGFEMAHNSGNDGIAPDYEDKGVVYLLDKMVEIDGIKIYGSPWQPRFYDWAFNVNRGEAIAKKWELIPENLDILVTHGPPYGMLDDTINGMRVGCEELYKKVVQVKPKYHIFGHIHFGYGMRVMEDTTYINAASLGENYQYTKNRPIIFYVDC